MKFLLGSLLVLFLIPIPAALAAAPSPLAGMSDAGQAYYRQVFDYSMDVLKSGQHYDWASYDGKGTIAVGALFVSKSGYTCRSFSESFAVQYQTGSGEGIACKRHGKEGWCKLKTGDAQTCAMEGPAGVFDAGMPDPNVDADFPAIGTSGGGDSGDGSYSGGGMSMPGINTGGFHSYGGGGGRGGGNNGSSGKDVANSVTSGMGNAAGSFAHTSKEWFSDIFR